jgi:protein TonB
MFVMAATGCATSAQETQVPSAAKVPPRAQAEDDAPLLLSPAALPRLLLFSPPPEYTEAARAAGAEGEVSTRTCVSSTGQLMTIKILRSLKEMDQHVVEVLATWRYRPFIYEGRPRAFCYVSNFVFKLN